MSNNSLCYRKFYMLLLACCVSLFTACGEGDSKLLTVPNLTAPRLEAPSNFTARNATQGFVILSWNDNSEDERGFLIQRSDNSGLVILGRVGQDGQIFRDEVLQPSHMYQYTVIALAKLPAEGELPDFTESVPSNTASLETPPFSGSLPMAPQNVVGSVIAGSGGLGLLKWDSNPLDMVATGVRVELHVVGNTWEQIRSSNADSVFVPLCCGSSKIHTYRIYSYSATVKTRSEYSEAVTITEP